MKLVETFKEDYKKLTFDQMIEHLKEKGVQFNFVSTENARAILESSNYFYKITAYRKNFDKNGKDQYINLDFLFLSDLATIDMRLRYIVLQMCLDIEHAIKTQILKDITNNTAEDGYSVVDDFLNYSGKDIEFYMNPIKERTHYNYGIYNKFRDSIPVWAIFEVFSFGNFVRFVEFYYSQVNTDKAHKDLVRVLKYVKNIRNSAAHSNPLLMDITRLNQIKRTPAFSIMNFVKRIPDISSDVRRKKLSNRKIHDLTALFFVYDKYISSALMKQARYATLNELLERSARNGEKYLAYNHFALKSVYDYFYKIVDFLTKEM